MKTEPNTMENLTKEQAEIILKIRDALALENIDEAYHYLYQIASPDFDKINPWSELERIAAIGSVAAPKEEPKKRPDFPEWLQTQDGKSCMEWPISEPKYLQNRLFWAFDAGRNCVWDQYVEQKNLIKELANRLQCVSQYARDSGASFLYDGTPLEDIDSLIKKSQKL